MPPAIPPQEQRFWQRVTKTETCWLWTGATLRDSRYGVMRWDGKVQPAHRIAWILAGNETTDGKELDHVCHVRICVNPDHLRLVTRKQNVENHQGALTTSRSGIRGVSLVNNRWRASLIHNGKRIHLGYFDTIDEADEVVTAKRNELWTHNDIDRAAG